MCAWNSEFYLRLSHVNEWKIFFSIFCSLQLPLYAWILRKKFICKKMWKSRQTFRLDWKIGVLQIFYDKKKLNWIKGWLEFMRVEKGIQKKNVKNTNHNICKGCSLVSRLSDPISLILIFGLFFSIKMPQKSFHFRCRKHFWMSLSCLLTISFIRSERNCIGYL